MPVYIRNQLRSLQFDGPGLMKLAQRILNAAGEPSSELSLTFVGDRRMRRLNRAYRMKDRTTDVLAFAMREAPGPPTRSQGVDPLGDIVISAPTALKQARTRSHSLDREIAVLLVHGILHLCGYDHERSGAEARRMQRRERAILRGLGPVSVMTRFPRHAKRGPSRSTPERPFV